MKYLISGYGTGSLPTIRRFCQDISVWTSSVPNPSYLCESGDLLFAVGEFDNYCTVTSFRKDGDSYQEKDTIRLEGTCLCHLDIHQEQHFLTGSCWETDFSSPFPTNQTELLEISCIRNTSPTAPGVSLGYTARRFWMT